MVVESYKNLHKTIETNIIGTLNILDISRDVKNLKFLIIITSNKCYLNKEFTRGYSKNDILGGDDPYSASKATAEIMLKAYQESFFKKKLIGVSSVRSGNVIEGGDWALNRLIPDCIKSIKKNKTIFLRNPNFNRPWQFVLEPLKGYLMLAQKQYQQPVRYSSSWNFGTKSNTVTSVKTIIRYIIDFWGKGKFKISKKFL